MIYRLFIYFVWNELSYPSRKSRSEQAPGREFHPCDKIYCGFLGPSWCNKKINLDTYVPCGSYELLLSNVPHQRKEKITIQNNFSNF